MVKCSTKFLPKKKLGVINAMKLRATGRPYNSKVWVELKTISYYSSYLRPKKTASKNFESQNLQSQRYQ